MFNDGLMFKVFLEVFSRTEFQTRLGCLHSMQITVGSLSWLAKKGDLLRVVWKEQADAPDDKPEAGWLDAISTHRP